MKRYLSLVTVLTAALVLAACSEGGASSDSSSETTPVETSTVIFFDDFCTGESSCSSSLDGSTPDIGGTWRAEDGDASISAGIVTTVNCFEKYTKVFADFAEPLGEGETLTLSFASAYVPDYNQPRFQTGWAGISLFNGSSESFFIGTPSGCFWGMVARGTTYPFNAVDAYPAQYVQLSYEYDTGNWSAYISRYSLGGGRGSHHYSGTTTARLALDRLRLGADSYNRADIALQWIQVVKE